MAYSEKEEAKMKKLLGVAVFVLLVTALVAAADQPEKIGGAVMASLSGSAVVQDIDYTTREATLKYDNGNIETIIAGPEVRNFNQVNKGDKVNIDYNATVALSIGGASQPPSRVQAVEVERAPLGQKPAGTFKTAAEISAVIEDVDYANRLVTVRGPQRVLKIKVDPQALNLEKIKKGDQVLLEVDESLSIKVTP
jgi:Cu/Ag efflux protein CusF